MNEHTITSLGDQALVLDQTSHEDFPREKDDTPTVLEVATVDNVNNFEHENAVDDLQKYQETDIKDKENTDEIGTIIMQELKDDSSNFLKSVCNEDDGGCKKNDVGSLACQDQTCSLKQVEVVETCTEKSRVKDVGCGSNSYRSVEKVMLDDPKEDFTENDVDDNKKNMQMPLLSQPHIQNQSFQGSFFFVDGGYRLLRSLTGGSNVPSLVLLDPIVQHHYVFNEDVDITYSSLVNFLDKFLNGSLSPYQLSASSAISYKEPQKPPFVNLDFHVVDPIPRVTTNTFCELVFGFDPCVSGGTVASSQLQNLGDAWNKDVLVFFGSSWCGFCQRVELIVREVYRAFKNLNHILECDNSFSNPVCPQGDIETYNLPSVFLMDCVQNDCAYFLKAVGKNELYPELLLYPALNKSAIPYVDNFSVVNIMKFLESQGRDSAGLNKYKGFLWKQSWNSSNRNARPHEATSSLISKAEPIPDVSTHQNVEPRAEERPLVETTPLQGLDNKRPYIVTGSMLFATEKLLQAIPFDNSSILIVFAGEDQAFQGVIINKPISWNVFDNLEKDLETIKQAPLYYGGPVRAQGLPLVSLTRKPIEDSQKL
ncbi:hypothetical protein HPP92_008370 [Vanilla planifolia]|uniref:Thioredoxin domain-containing protein n=1 Tax=Vanilla planifolia TaxID=51239 RepID=A0A835R667_VANPL|nr:hypothetical protein HPP92_008370 [Vanilla planifolia]